MSNHRSYVTSATPHTVSELGSAPSQISFSRKELSILLGLLIVLCIAVFPKFIFGHSVYQFKDIGSDTLNIYYPFLTNISKTLHEGSLPGWSFEQGLGQNVFPFSLSEPTTYILFLLGGDTLPFGLIWIEIFKIICGGMLFACFLKMLKLHSLAACIGGLLFAFSGFMIVGGGWYIFSTLGMYTALLLYSFEKLYSQGKWWLFPIAVSMIAALNLVNLYTCSLLLLSYLLFRILAEGEIDITRVKALLFRMMLLGMLGVLISAVFSLPNLLQMIESPRVSGNASLSAAMKSIPVFAPGGSEYLVTLLMRTFSSDLIGNGSAYQGWSNFLEAPMSYCGLITLLLLPQIFIFINARQKFIFGIFAGLYIFVAIFPWFRRGFWLFQGDYFRDLSLYTSVVFIILSMMVLDKVIRGGKLNLFVLLASLSVLLVLLYFPYVSPTREGEEAGFQWQASAVDTGIQARITMFLVLGSIVLFIFSTARNKKLAQGCLIALVLFELASFSHTTVNRREAVTASEIGQKTGYNDYSAEAISYIKQQDKDAFFRIEKNYSSSPAIHFGLNDSKVQHYFGSSSYNNFHSLNYINFLSSVGVLNPEKENETRWVSGVRNQPLLQVLTGVRYLLYKGDWKPSSMAVHYHEIGKAGDVSILKSNNALPLGVAYDAYIVYSEFAKLDTMQKHIALLKAIAVPDRLASSLPAMRSISANDLRANVFSTGDLASDTNILKAHSLQIKNFSNNLIVGEIDNRIEQLVFFSFPFDSEWKAQVNGKEAAVLAVDGGLSAIKVGPGKNVISLRYFPPFVKYGLILTLLGLLIFGALLFRLKTTVTASEEMR